MKKTLPMLAWWSLPGGAQDPMSLRDAVHLALDKNKSVEASVAANRINFLKIAPAGRLAGRPSRKDASFARIRSHRQHHLVSVF